MKQMISVKFHDRVDSHDHRACAGFDRVLPVSPVCYQIHLNSSTVHIYAANLLFSSLIFSKFSWLSNQRP